MGEVSVWWERTDVQTHASGCDVILLGSAATKETLPHAAGTLDGKSWQRHSFPILDMHARSSELISNQRCIGKQTIHLRDWACLAGEAIDSS